MNKIRRLHAYKVAPLQDTPQQVPLQCPPMSPKLFSLEPSALWSSNHQRHFHSKFMTDVVKGTSLAKRASRGADEEHVRRIKSIPTLAHVSEHSDFPWKGHVTQTFSSNILEVVPWVLWILLLKLSFWSDVSSAAIQQLLRFPARTLTILTMTLSFFYALTKLPLSLTKLSSHLVTLSGDQGSGSREHLTIRSCAAHWHFHWMQRNVMGSLSNG